MSKSMEAEHRAECELCGCDEHLPDRCSNVFGEADQCPCGRMEVVIKLISRADGAPSAADGKYLMAYDAAAFNGRGLIETTPDVRSAKRYREMIFAINDYRSEAGLRADLQPNRPLTAYSVEFLWTDSVDVAEWKERQSKR